MEDALLVSPLPSSPAWTMHANPVVIDGVMYITTPSLKAVALNAATGKEIWAFAPAKYNNGNVVRLRNRGVVHWKGSGGDRIFHFVRDRVYAVDAKTGVLMTTFGTDGFIDLRQNPGVDPATAVIVPARGLPRRSRSRASGATSGSDRCRRAVDGGGQEQSSPQEKHEVRRVFLL